MQPEDEAPRQFAPLPGRTLDTRATFERCLAEMLDVLACPVPSLPPMAVVPPGCRRRVRMALLDFLRTGTDPERAGAARAWYWTLVPLSFRSGSDTPTRKGQAEAEAFADLDDEWDRTALQVFVTNTDLDVRKCLVPGLDLRAEHWPDELRETVAEAIRIARTHPDEYLRQRVEHQI